MRVISGKLKGRTIKGYKINGTRPTMDRVKESVFSTIYRHLNDSVCLDLFAGSGSLGIEAISNGAKKVYFVDNNKLVIRTLKENVQVLDINENSIIYQGDYYNALKYFKSNNVKFDLIFLDPPYNLEVVDKILNYINNFDILNEEGLIICEVGKDDLSDKYGNLTLIKNKKMGVANIYIYKNIIE